MPHDEGSGRNSCAIWQRADGYGRSLADTAVAPFKANFGPRLYARGLAAEYEAAFAVGMLNGKIQVEGRFP